MLWAIVLSVITVSVYRLMLISVEVHRHLLLDSFVFSTSVVFIIRRHHSSCQ